MRRRASAAAGLCLVITACSGDPPAADSTETSGAGSTATGAATAGEGSTSTDAVTTGPGPGPTATGATLTATTTDATSGSSSGSGSGSTSAPGTTSGTTTEDGESSSGAASTGEGICTPDDVLDVVSYNFVKVTDLGLVGVSAGYYNSAAGELVFLSKAGTGVRTELGGVELGDVAAPMALGELDGAVYDPATDTALLIDKACVVAEVDPVTLAELSVVPLDADMLAIESCSGIAQGPGGSLFIASRATDEVVVISRDLMDEVDRFSASGNGIESIDGITAIPGSENFLLTSGAGSFAAILTQGGEVVSPATEIGGGIAPLVGGGELAAPDGLFSVCANGQVWLCRGLTTSCSKFAPEGGGDDVCDCLVTP